MITRREFLQDWNDYHSSLGKEKVQKFVAMASKLGLSELEFKCLLTYVCMPDSANRAYDYYQRTKPMEVSK